MIILTILFLSIISIVSASFSNDATAGIQFRMVRGMLNDLKNDILKENPISFDYDVGLEPSYNQIINLLVTNNTLHITDVHYDLIQFDV